MAPLVADLDREVFWVLLLNQRNVVTGINLVSIGTLATALVHPREVFKSLIVGNAAGALLVHYHPSGDPTPSADDVAITKRLREAGDLLGIAVLDHIILGEGGAYRSFADDGWSP
jgi:DNA repair protein RadC